MNPHDLYVITELKGSVPTPIHNEPLTFRQLDALVETITHENYVVWTLEDWYSTHVAPYTEIDEVRMFI